VASGKGVIAKESLPYKKMGVKWMAPFWTESKDGPEEYQCDECKRWEAGRPEYWYEDKVFCSSSCLSNYRYREISGYNDEGSFW
jgi:hypothetical protein